MCIISNVFCEHNYMLKVFVHFICRNCIFSIYISPLALFKSSVIQETTMEICSGQDGGKGEGVGDFKV